jgi:hypothetical protein
LERRHVKFTRRNVFKRRRKQFRLIERNRVAMEYEGNVSMFERGEKRSKALKIMKEINKNQNYYYLFFRKLEFSLLFRFNFIWQFYIFLI